MTGDDMVRAIEGAAQERVARMFNVLCDELIGQTNVEHQRSVIARFGNGVRGVKAACDAAIAAIGQEEGS